MLKPSNVVAMNAASWIAIEVEHPARLNFLLD